MAKRHLLGDDYAGLFLRLEELVLANSGEDEFEEILKLIYAKLIDEIEYDSTLFHGYGSVPQTYTAISKLLGKAIERWPGVFEVGTRPKLTPEHLSVCVDVLATRSIFETGLEVMDGAFEYLTSHTSKGAKGQYFTPRHVVDLCVRIVNPQLGELVADPACGSGAFLVHTLRHMVPELTDTESLNSDKHFKLKKICSQSVWGFDFEHRATKVAKALMLLLGDGSSNIVRLNSLEKTRSQSSLFSHSRNDQTVETIDDVVRRKQPAFKGFDVILTNPPFAGEVREPALLNEYEIYRRMPTRKVERDALFLERCVELLKPGGRLAIVLPDNKLASEMWRPLREWLISQVRIVSIVSLPRTVFMPHTSQKTCILFAQKRYENLKVDGDEPILFAISDAGGKDSRGCPIYKTGNNGRGIGAWDALDHDFAEIVRQFKTSCSFSST